MAADKVSSANVLKTAGPYPQEQYMPPYQMTGPPPQYPYFGPPMMYPPYYPPPHGYYPPFSYQQHMPPYFPPPYPYGFPGPMHGDHHSHSSAANSHPAKYGPPGHYLDGYQSRAGPKSVNIPYIEGPPPFFPYPGPYSTHAMMQRSNYSGDQS